MNARMLIVVVVSMFVCQQVHAQNEPEVEVTELEGTWVVVSMVIDGERWDVDGRNFWRFKGNEMYGRTGDENWTPVNTFSVDPSAIPAEVDWPGGWPGIYELDGDSLTICLGLGSRPDRFESIEDYPTILYVLRRVEDE